jgi:hypothetical protein
MIAGWLGLLDYGLTFGEQPGQQDGRLDLCTRHRQSIADAVQSAASDPERRKRSVVPAVDARAHEPQGFRDAAHRPSAQRGVSGQRASEGLPGEHTCHEAHRRSGVATVEDIIRFAEAVQPGAADMQDGSFASFIQPQIGAERSQHGKG